MADRLLICKHNDGLGHCDVFGGEYCVESPCQHEELVEYAPVVHGEWMPIIEGVWNLPMPVLSGYRCSKCGRTEQEKEPYCHCGADMRERKGDDER